MKKLFIFLFLLLGNYVLAQIVEIKKISETKDLDACQLIIFDLDNTILEPVQLLGSDQWFYHTLRQYEREGMDSKDALEKVFVQWYEIQAITKVKLVENKTKDLIESLQSKKIKLMGLTSRNPDFALASIKQLNSLEIDLGKTAPYKKDLFFENGMVFRKGILFSQGKNKGKALKCFFSKIGFFPKSAVFIDDKLKHVAEVEDFCKTYKIRFIGYRYGYLDDKIKNFNYEIPNIQYRNLKNILSDEQAAIFINNLNE